MSQTKPTSPLAYYRILSPSAGVRVSPICLGAMHFGEAGKASMGECTKETAFEILDHFYENGGNFVDTANMYQRGQSEEWLGEWMDLRKTRDEMVVATKYTTSWIPSDKTINNRINYQGNHVKSMMLSFEGSLKKLRTSYIDLFYVHWWDFSTSVAEVMRALNNLVVSGKVHYLGISDCPAWVVVKANDYANQHGLTPFSVYQGRYSAAVRDAEREIFPMIEDQGMAFCAYGALGSGNLKTKEQREQYGHEGRSSFTNSVPEKYEKVTDVLDVMAQKRNTQITSLALAYVMHKVPYLYPLIGCRKLSHLQQNIEALKLKLTEEEMDEIDGAVPFDPGFPMGFLFQFYNPKVPYKPSMTTKDIPLVRSAGSIDTVDKPRPIAPHED